MSGSRLRISEDCAESEYHQQNGLDEEIYVGSGDDQNHEEH